MNWMICILLRVLQLTISASSCIEVCVRCKNFGYLLVLFWLQELVDNTMVACSLIPTSPSYWQQENCRCLHHHHHPGGGRGFELRSLRMRGWTVIIPLLLQTKKVSRSSRWKPSWIKVLGLSLKLLIGMVPIQFSLSIANFLWCFLLLWNLHRKWSPFVNFSPQ